MKEFLAGKGGTILTILGGFGAIWLTTILGKHLPADIQVYLVGAEGSLAIFLAGLAKGLLSPSPSTTTTTLKTSSTMPDEEITKT